MKDIFEQASRRLSSLVEDKTHVLEFAENIVQSHWQFVRVEQHRIKQKLQRGDKSESPTAVAPYVRIKKGDFIRSKPYIIWREWKHNPNSRSGGKRSLITDLKPYQRGYTDTFFAKNCQPWLAGRSIQTERYLRYLRAQLDAIHDDIIKQRKIVERLKSEMENDNG